MKRDCSSHRKIFSLKETKKFIVSKKANEVSKNLTVSLCSSQRRFFHKKGQKIIVSKKANEASKNLMFTLCSIGRGEFIVGLTEDLVKQELQAGQFIGLISHVNIFDKALDSEDIKWMSQGCGKDVLLAIFPWSQFIDGVVGDVKVEKPALCADPEGDLRSGVDK